MSQSSPSHTCTIFLHLHKTGGMSLRGLFAKAYPSSHQFNTEIIELNRPNWDECCQRIGSMSPEEQAHYAVLKGHMFFGLHERIKRPCRYVTFLREPVSRVISYYRMAKRKGQLAPDHVIIPTKPDWNLGSVPELAGAFDNGQTRAIAAVDPDLPLGACTAEHLETAKRNLDRHFAVVGLMEQFDLSLLMLQRACGWKQRYYVPDNVTEIERAPLPPATIEAIATLNRFDLDLYRHASERFQETVRAQGWRLQARHRLFRVGNSVHQWLHCRRAARKSGGAESHRCRMRPLPKAILEPPAPR